MKKFIAVVDIKKGFPIGHHFVQLLNIQGDVIGHFSNTGTEEKWFKQTVLSAVNTFMSNYTSVCGQQLNKVITARDIIWIVRNI